MAGDAFVSTADKKWLQEMRAHEEVQHSEAVTMAREVVLFEEYVKLFDQIRDVRNQAELW